MVLNNTFNLSYFLPFFREDTSAEARLQRAVLSDELDSRYGFDRYKEPQERVGWLMNMHPVTTKN